MKERQGESSGKSYFKRKVKKTRSVWFNSALRGDEAVYWVSIGQQWLVLIVVLRQDKAVPINS